jgi:hypothetical protein
MSPSRFSPVRSVDDVEQAAEASRAGKTRVFISFDIEHDGELYELLLAQSRMPGSVFAVSGGSERLPSSDARSERAHRRIGEADQVIVICGEHTDMSTGVFTELRIAQEEKKPYFLLWGRRESMCTKPMGAKNAEGMYSWTQQILRDQLALTLRIAHGDAAAKSMRNATRKVQSSPSAIAPEPAVVSQADSDAG